MTQDDRITYDKVLNPDTDGYIAPGRCISSTDKGSRYLILPVYENMKTPAKKKNIKLDIFLLKSNKNIKNKYIKFIFKIIIYKFLH